ncbi:MAG: terminase family protein [Candidatus Wallbacteria bacterium]
MNNKFFLPYQIEWLKDKSKIKIWEKSRRIGATYVQSYEDVEDCAAGRVPAVWFSSADESAAKEYIIYCERWAKLLNLAAKPHNEEFLDEEKDVKTFVIEFNNGSKITAMSSSPKRFRSKGGKVILDEFAWHEDQRGLWTAAKPCITWGYPLRILSTHNGQSCLYYKFIDEIKKGQLNWNLHTTPIQKAVEDGLADKILKKKLTKKEREQWIEDERKSCADEFTWQQEYCCIPVDEVGAFLPYELIGSCESHQILRDLEECQGNLYLGYDIARRKHLSVIWLLEELGDVLYTRMVKVMEKAPFSVQWQVLSELLRNPKIRRACIDATGLGMQLAETAQEMFGKYRVEMINFAGKTKGILAYKLLTRFQDSKIRVPADHDVREDLHSVRKIVSVSNNERFDVDMSNTDGHGDRFWALGLAVNAADDSAGPIIAASSTKRRTPDFLKNYGDFRKLLEGL